MLLLRNGGLAQIYITVISSALIMNSSTVTGPAQPPVLLLIHKSSKEQKDIVNLLVLLENFTIKTAPASLIAQLLLNNFIAELI
jgi:hypothetical protein